jgi:hypothetical protein
LDRNEENADNMLELLGCLLQNLYKAKQEICPEACAAKSAFSSFSLRRGCLEKVTSSHACSFLVTKAGHQKDVTGP